MARARKEAAKSKSHPASTPEARENQMIALAVDLAEEQLRNGTASTAVITHYLKLGSSKEALEKEYLARRTDLIDAKTDSIRSSKEIEELYANALDAMRVYNGSIRTYDD